MAPLAGASSGSINKPHFWNGSHFDATTRIIPLYHHGQESKRSGTATAEVKDVPHSPPYPTHEIPWNDLGSMPQAVTIVVVIPIPEEEPPIGHSPVAREAPPSVYRVGAPGSTPALPTATPKPTASLDNEGPFADQKQASFSYSLYTAPEPSHHTSSISLVRANPTNDGNAKGQFTTIEEKTTFVTKGVLTTAVTTTLPNGRTTVTSGASGTRTLAAETGVVSQIGSVSSRPGPWKDIIGGVIGAVAIVILGSVALCIMRRKCRQRARLSSGSNSKAPHSAEAPGAPRTSELSVTPRPFLGLPSAQGSPSIKQGSHEHVEPPDSLVRNGQEDEGPEDDPFKDPAVVGQEEPLNEEIREARNALDRLQQLTSQLEAELQQLSELARFGQLSAEGRARLEEIRRTAGLTVPFNPRRHLSATSSDSSYSTAPPSYHTDGT